MIEQMQQHTMSGGSEKLKEGIQEVGRAFAETATHTCHEYTEQSRTIIRDNPFRSVLFAFGIGILAGILLFRRG